MDIRIIRRDREVRTEVEAHVRGRTRDTLGRFGHWVQGVLVRLADLNGPRGGANDKSVAIEVDLRTVGAMRFEARADTYERALAIALNRAKRSVLSSPELGGRRPIRRAAQVG